MELRDSIMLFKRQRRLVITLLVIVVGSAYAWSYSQATRYTNSLALTVNRTDRQQTNDYQYDGYYALQAADIFSQTLVSWLQTPSVILEIYQKAGLTADLSSIRSLVSRFKTKKYSAQNVVVAYTTSSEAEGKRLADALGEVIGNRTVGANRNGDGQALFEVQSSTPVIVRSVADPVIIGGVALIVAITLAAFLVPFIDYLSRGTRH